MPTILPPINHLHKRTHEPLFTGLPFSAGREWQVDKHINKSHKQKGSPSRQANCSNPSILRGSYTWHQELYDVVSVFSSSKDATVTVASVEEVAELKDAGGKDPESIEGCDDFG